MPCSQLIEQLTLHRGAGQAVQFLLHLPFEQTAKLFEAFEAERLGKIFVDLGFVFDLNLVHLHIEGSFLTREVFRRIIFGERHGNGLLVTCLRAGELFFEAGNELARADHQRRFFRLATVEFDTVELADEIDDQLIAIGRLLRLGGIFPALLLAGDLFERFVHFRIGDRNSQAFELDAIGSGRFEIGQHFEADRQFGILALIVAFAQFDLGLHRRAQLLVAHQRIDRILDRVVHHLSVNRIAVHLTH